MIFSLREYVKTSCIVWQVAMSDMCPAQALLQRPFVGTMRRYLALEAGRLSLSRSGGCSRCSPPEGLGGRGESIPYKKASILLCLVMFLMVFTCFPFQHYHFAYPVDYQCHLQLRLVLKAETSVGRREGVQGLLRFHGGSKVQRYTIRVLCCKAPTVSWWTGRRVVRGTGTGTDANNLLAKNQVRPVSVPHDFIKLSVLKVFWKCFENTNLVWILTCVGYHAQVAASGASS